MKSVANAAAYGDFSGGPTGVSSRQGHLTPYWAPLAAVNEQVRGGQDPWVAWVRRQLAGN